MERQSTPFRRYLALALIVVLVPFFLLGTAIAATGTVSVRVEEQTPEGTDLRLVLPALLLDVALLAAPWVMPDDALAEARQSVAPYRDGLEAVADELASCPRGVLVEIESDEERVVVTKSWRSFVVEVESEGTEVRVSVPARSLSQALRILG